MTPQSKVMDPKVPAKHVMRNLPWEVRRACKQAKVPCGKRNSRLLVRVATSLVTSTRLLPGWGYGRWFRIPGRASIKLDKVLPTIFTPYVKEPDMDTLHGAFNQFFCDARLGEQGFELRRKGGFWEIRIVNANLENEGEMPILLPVQS